MIDPQHEQQLEREFAEFVAAEPLPPAAALDEMVSKRVARDLRPPWWKVWGTLTLVEVTAGLLTLTLCPQFGVGFGQHNEFLHALHATTTPPVFYLLCGLLFVSFGAAFGGLILPRGAIRSLGRQKYLYFTLYTLLVYLALVTLGTEAFVLSSLVWMVGGLLGNIVTFNAVIRLRLLAN